MSDKNKSRAWLEVDLGALMANYREAHSLLKPGVEMICVLKASLPIDMIKNLLLKSVEGAQESEIYNKFCEDFEESVHRAAEAVSADPGIVTIYRAALRAQAEQALSRKLYEELFRA